MGSAASTVRRRSWAPWVLVGGLLTTASVAVELEGQAATLRVVATVQRLLDSGHGQTQDPTWVASIGPGFWW